MVPYLISDSYAGLQSRVGFIFGSICVLGLVWAYFFFPELKGRSLEEIDEFFQAKVPAGKSRGKMSLILQMKSTVMLISATRLATSGTERGTQDYCDRR